jgi:hypothetical protein
MAETPIVKAIQKRAMSELGWKLFRNNVGRLQTKQGQWIQYGLCVGSSDLIGWRTLTVGPEMVGRKFAQFIAVEVKTPKGVVSEEQEAFLKTVQEAGGMANVFRSENELPEGI